MLRARLFVISYVPFFIIVAIRAFRWPLELSLQGVVFWIALGFSFIGIVDVFNLLQASQRSADIRRDITDVDDAGEGAAGYLTSYLLPFLAAPTNDWKVGVSYVLYLVVLFVIFVRSRFGLINPTLYLFGWRVVQAKTMVGTDDLKEKQMTILCKQIPEPGVHSLVRFMDGYIIYEKARKRGHENDQRQPG